MKRIFSIIFAVLMLIALLGISCSAEEIADVPGADVTDTTVEIPEENATPETVPEEAPTFIDRVAEMIDEGQIWELLSLVATLVFFVLIYAFKKLITNLAAKITGFGDKVSTSIGDNREDTKKALEESKRQMDGVVEYGIGKIKEYVDDGKTDIEGFKTETFDMFRAMVESVNASAAEIKALVEKNAVETRKAERMLADVAKILNTVYMGSSTIPSITKEKVMEIYESTEKKLGAGEESNNE